MTLFYKKNDDKYFLISLDSVKVHHFIDIQEYMGPKTKRQTTCSIKI